MKKIFLIAIVMLLSVVTFAQMNINGRNVNVGDTMTINGQIKVLNSDMQFEDYVAPKSTTITAKEVCADKTGTYTRYVASNGTIYNVGDTIILGRPSQPERFMYITKTGALLAIGGTQSSYSSYGGGNATTYGAGIEGSNTGARCKIVKIKVEGTKRAGYNCIIVTQGIVGSLPVRFSIQYESALAAGEVKSMVLSSNEALAELKQEKDKFDLGLITQQQYETRKAELVKYIK